MPAPQARAILFCRRDLPLTPEPVRCPNCGAPTAPTDTFCPECGHRLAQSLGPFAPTPPPSGAPSSRDKGFFADLFDCGFTDFVTPKVVKFVYVIATIIIALKRPGAEGNPPRLGPRIRQQVTGCAQWAQHASKVIYPPSGSI
ncbi:zinc ribbon domain-containing protein [Streptomyces sviceus]|uniref:zinc ribbon domain-containing protein n=1 Tax=Streptomyces sviceus TaxID=285530 RepID=UPI0036805778